MIFIDKKKKRLIGVEKEINCRVEKVNDISEIETPSSMENIFSLNTNTNNADSQQNEKFSKEILIKKAEDGEYEIKWSPTLLGHYKLLITFQKNCLLFPIAVNGNQLF